MTLTQRGDGKARSPFQVPYLEREPRAGPPADRRLRSRTAGFARPSLPRRETRAALSRRPIEADLVGRRTRQPGVRALAVVPVGEERQLPPDAPPPDRRQPAPHAFVLERADAALDERDAAVLADRAEALADPDATTAASERPRRELTSAVRDQVLRRPPCGPDHAGQEGAHRHRRQPDSEDPDPHDPAREVVDADGEPAAERPAVGKRPGQPRDPEPGERRDSGQVDQPDMVRARRPDATLAADCRRRRRATGPVLQHPTDRRPPEM